MTLHDEILMVKDYTSEFPIQEEEYKNEHDIWEQKQCKDKGRYIFYLKNEPIGLWLNSCDGHFLSNDLIYIKQSYRKRGIGTRVLNEITKLASKQPHLILISCCDNDISVHLHEKCGYTRINHPLATFFDSLSSLHNNRQITTMFLKQQIG